MTPDFLADLKVWLKNNATLTPLVGRRVFFRIPTTPSAWPLLRIYQSGGGVITGGEYPVLSDVRVGIEIWGNTFKLYDKVRQTRIALEEELNNAVPQLLNPPDGQTFLSNAWVTGCVDMPDPSTGWPRFVADVVLTIKPTS
jgi:hypothetical protein